MFHDCDSVSHFDTTSQSNHCKAIPAGCPPIILQPSPAPAAPASPLWFLFPLCFWQVEGVRTEGSERGKELVSLSVTPRLLQPGSPLACCSPGRERLRVLILHPHRARHCAGCLAHIWYTKSHSSPKKWLGKGHFSSCLVAHRMP